MTFLCLYGKESIPPVPLLSVVPRVYADTHTVWADVRGMPVRETVSHVRRSLPPSVVAAMKVGVANTPIAAEVSARYARQSITYVPDGGDRAFLAPFPIGVLQPERTLANLLDGAGIETCHDLANVSRESVEVRFGGAGAQLWRLARADDTRRIFSPVPRSLPVASLEWTDYTLRRAERLIFVINALCGNVCEALRERGEGAVSMTMLFALANCTTVEYTLRAARATAAQQAWMRLLRLELERIVLPDAVVGITLRIDAIGGLGGKQGDVFDRGFGTAQAAEEAIGSLLDDQGAVIVAPTNNAHPLLDRRTTWVPYTAAQAIDMVQTSIASSPVVRSTSRSTSRSTPLSNIPALTLQLLPNPQRIIVTTALYNYIDKPSSYRDAHGMHTIVEAAGPDRISGGQWDAPYAREYFRCVTDSGLLVWIYRDACTSTWYLHGWWD